MEVRKAIDCSLLKFLEYNTIENGKNSEQLFREIGVVLEEGRIIGLDVGEVRTGVALTDELQIISSPFDTVQVSTPEEDARRIQQIVEEQEAIRIVAGVPLGKDGEIGPQAEKVLAFLDVLKGIVSVEVVTIDERFSTKAANRSLIQANVKRKGRKKVIDKVAAQQILQLYLDREAARRRREE